MKNPHTWRYLTIQFMLAVFGFSILLQIVRVQNSAEVKDILVASGMFEGQSVTYYPSRGEIYDRSGHLLAGNETVYEVGLDLNVMKDLNPSNLAAFQNNIALAAQLYLDMTYREALEKMMNPPEGAVYIVIADFVPAEKAEKLIKLRDDSVYNPIGQNLNGMHFKERLQRSYTEYSLASNLIGVVPPQDERGHSGVEEKHNNLLAGTPLTVWVPANPILARELTDVPAGATLILTILRDVQAATEEILDAAITNTGAESGSIVIMDPKTGEILAMATSPRPNLNDFANYGNTLSSEHPLNPAISKPYEPGSVYKIFTMAAALEKGVVKPEDTYWDHGIIIISEVPIHNWNDTVWGLQDMVGCLRHSINTCLVWVASQLGKEDFYSFMQKFGFGHTTGIDLADEVSGYLKFPGDQLWHPLDLGTNAFGQGVSVTPIQMVMAASSFANGGRMVYPHVLYASVQDGQQHNTSPQVVGSPISAATAHTLNEMLAISLEAEGSKAVVPGYRLAGKTGTAEIPTTGGYLDSVTNASFIGWGPLDDPQFMVYVWLEKPKSSLWGSEVAAPVFKQVVERLVVLLRIPPDNVRLQLAGQ
ncbi:MAG: penicillin-binding protein 2 [Anaerolineales bacterium]|nr:penicillin-binding protein 2 [Anaerolineales bacterium]